MLDAIKMGNLEEMLDKCEYKMLAEVLAPNTLYEYDYQIYHSIYTESLRDIPNRLKGNQRVSPH